jgi:hypothetical protein
MIDLATLKSLLRKIENISHINKTDKAYYDATEIAKELSEKIPNNKHIKLDVKILKNYRFKESDRKKESVINDFKENSIHDVISVISEIENNPPNDL